MRQTSGMVELQEYAVDGTKARPSVTEYEGGVVAGQDLPEAWWNYLMNVFTKGNDAANTTLSNLLTELATVLAAAGINPSDTGGTATDQLKTALDYRYLYGDNGKGTVNIIDLNTIAKSGFYCLITPYYNGPTVAAYNVMHIENISALRKTQIAIATGSSLSYIRSYNGSAWSTWAKLWNADNDGTGSGSDADMVDGVQGNRIIYGDDAYGTSTVTDANAITKTGFYQIGGGAGNHAPIDSETYWCIYHVRGSGPNSAAQIAIRATGSGSFTYTRIQSAGVWTAWAKLWNADNDGAGSGMDTDLVRGKDLIAQTSLNSGLICAPLASVPEWPDNAAGTTYFQDAWATVDGWTSTFSTLSPSLGRLSISYVTRLSATKTVAVASGQTIRLRYDFTACAVTGAINLCKDDGTTLAIITSSASKGVFDYTTVGVLSGIRIESYLATGTAYIDWIYVGDGTYSSLALDGSGNGNHATVVGATPIDTVAGRGFSFDKLNDRLILDILKNTFTGVFAFSAYIQGKPSRAADQYVFGRDTGSTGGRGIRCYVNSSNRMVMALSLDGTALATVTADAGSEITADARVSYVFVPSVGLYLYKNGVLIKSNTTGIPASVYYSASQTMAIGDLNVSYGAIYDGFIADPRIYNRALSAEEDWELYSKPGMARMSGVIDSVTAVPNSRVIRKPDGVNEADTLGGIVPDRFVFGSDSTASTGLADANLAIKSGFYIITAPFTNTPESAETLILTVGTANRRVQLAISTSTNKTFIRNWGGSAWSAWAKVWNGDNDGTGSGMDSDIVRGTTPGTQGLAYLSKTTQALMAAILLTDLKTVDGVGSGMDADLLDGQHASYFARADGVGLVIENRTSDPASPGSGQIWLRTDL